MYNVYSLRFRLRQVRRVLWDRGSRVCAASPVLTAPLAAAQTCPHLHITSGTEVLHRYNYSLSSYISLSYKAQYRPPQKDGKEGYIVHYNTGYIGRGL